MTNRTTLTVLHLERTSEASSRTMLTKELLLEMVNQGLSLEQILQRFKEDACYLALKLNRYDQSAAATFLGLHRNRLKAYLSGWIRRHQTLIAGSDNATS